MNPSRQALGQAIAIAREEAGLTQDTLGVASGLGQTVISRIESGDRKIGALELVRIAEALGTSTGELMDAATCIASPSIPGGNGWELLHLRLEQAAPDVSGEFAWLKTFLKNLEHLRQIAHDA